MTRTGEAVLLDWEIRFDSETAETVSAAVLAVVS